MARMIIKESEIRQYVRSLIRETIETEARGSLSDNEKAAMASELQKMRSGQPFNIQHFPTGGTAMKEFGQMLKDRGIKKPGKTNGVKPYLFQFTDNGIENLTPEHSEEYTAQRNAKKREETNKAHRQNYIPKQDAKRIADQYGVDYKDVKNNKNYTKLSKYINDNDLKTKEGFRILTGDEQLALSPEEREQYRQDLRDHEMSKQSQSYDQYRGLQMDLSSHASAQELIDKLARTEENYRKYADNPFIDSELDDNDPRRGRRNSIMATDKRVEKDIVRILKRYHGMKDNDIAMELGKRGVVINDILGEPKYDTTLDDFDINDFDLGDEYDGADEKAQAAAEKAQRQSVDGETNDEDDDDNGIADDTFVNNSDDNFNDEDDPQFYRNDYDTIDDEDDSEYDEDGILRYDDNDDGYRRKRSRYSYDDDFDDF